MGRFLVVKKFRGMIVFGVLALLLSGRPALAAQDPWPKRFEHPKGTVVMYQPQMEDFKNDVLTGRAAVSVKKKEWKEPVFGAVWLSGRVRTDRDTRMATIDDVKITDAKFPDAKPEQLEKLKTFLNTETQDWTFTISLDRLLATLEVVEKEKAGDRGLKNEPPRIIFVTHPAVLVPLDGDPKLLPVPKSALMRVANTPFLMFYDPSARTYYLKAGEDWLAAADLKGPWKDLEKVPAAIKTLEAEAEKAAKGKGAAKKVEAGAGKIPEIIVSTAPAELLATAGEPQYTPVKDTNLLYVSNTESAIFLDIASREYYVLLSGRWFKSKSLQEGPWAYVAPDGLPADFARIPENSVKGFVLAAVAGTTQAKEAVLDNSIPQTAIINREKATTKVGYAGDPKFEPIPGTDLEYAVNTGKAVFKEGGKYYAVDQGVWYEADSPNGPWKASVHPPKEVDKLPPSNPNYNAKYVKVYESTDDTVTVGYTPGYTGSYVDNGTVVYGTGYSYSGYSAPDVYIPPPATYGYAATYNPYAATWGCQPSYYDPASWLVPGLVGFGVGVITGAAVSHWWGPTPVYWGGGGWWGAGGYNNININNIHNNVIRPGPHPPGPPGPHPPGPPPGPRPGPPAPLQAHQPNIYNRPGNQQMLASKPASRPVSTAPGQRPGQIAGKPPASRPGGPGQAAGPRPAQPKVRPAGGQNNVLADRNGNVYRKTPQGWQERQGNQWTKPAGAAGARPSTAASPARPEVTRPPTRPEAARPATRPEISRPATPPAAASRPGFDSSQLNRDFAARQRGEMRTQNFQRAGAASRPSPNFSRPGGGARPGGGGRRR